MSEAHEVKSTYNMEFLIIKKLLPLGYKNLFIESGVSEAAILNLFMKSGDTTLLRNTRACTRSGAYKEFISELYEENKKNNYGLTFYGFDFERAPCLNYLFNKWFAAASINDPELKTQINSLLNIEVPKLLTTGYLGRSSAKIQPVFTNIKNSFSRFESSYRELLKEDFEVFKEIIFNPVYANEFNERDKHFTANLLAREKDKGLAKSIIIVGGDHVVYKKAFVPTLYDNLPPKYSFTNFVFIYKDCAELCDRSRFTSDKQWMKYMNAKNTNKPLITFTACPDKIVPTQKPLSSNVIVALYYQ